jgi:nicotinamidase-related amidase
VPSQKTANGAFGRAERRGAKVETSFEVFVVADACGGITAASHESALRRMEAAGARMTSWIQALLELQRDWARHETYDGARAIVETYGGGHGIGLAYARQMIRPG